MRALIVDESRAVRVIVKRVLAEHGYDEVRDIATLDAASSEGGGDDGFFDLLILDAATSGTVADLRAGPRWLTTTIVVLAGEATEVAGADVVVAKPFTTTQLVEQICAARQVGAGAR